MGAARARSEQAEQSDEPRDVLTGMAVGLLAMLPLLAAYEWSLAGGLVGRRNVGERLLLLAFDPLGEHVVWVRVGLLLLAGLAALWTVRARGVALRPALARVLIEGVVVAIALGPLLVLLLSVGSGVLPRLEAHWDPGTRVPPLATAALLFGGSAWEELCFRVGGYGLCFVLARAPLRALGASESWSQVVAEISGLVGSTLFFAAAHLSLFNAWLGRGGAQFDAGLFTWLCLAGMLLGLVFRLRGPGVAAWAHGLFNLALLVGVDPDILL